MASPTVASRTTSSVDTNGTTHAVSMPSGVVSGNLLITFMCADGNTVLTVPTGWTNFFDPDPSTHIRFVVAYKQSDGTEGASQNWITDFAQKSAHTTYRITGHENPTTQAPESSTGVDGLDTSPDPDNLDPTGGEKDFLWLAGHGHDGAVTTTAFPTNYTDGISTESSSGGDAGVGSAERQLTATAENPVNFTISADEQWVAGTIAVHPAAAGGFVPYPNPRYVLTGGMQPMDGGV